MSIDELQAIESTFRLSLFIGILLIVAAWECLAPRRNLTQSKLVRWTSNIGISAISTFLLRLLMTASALEFARIVEENSWGLFNTLSIPYVLATILAILLLDMAIYLQHVMFHHVPLFWRLHRMHHADTDFDVTTGIRFHPIEILLSFSIKLSVIYVLGIGPLAILIFEVLLNGTAMFNHGNIRLPQGLDCILRLFVVTPDMHRVHHSVHIDESNSNFGFNMPWWDRIFGTYRAQPRDGHTDMQIGMQEFRESRWLYLHRLLVLPFINYRG